MSLKKTTALVSLSLLLVMLAAFVMLYYTLFRRSFLKMEAAHTEQHLRGLQHTLNSDFRHLDSVAADYASWDLTYDYMANHTPGYVKSELSDDSLNSLNVHLFMLLDPNENIELLKLIGDLPRALTATELKRIASAASRLGRNNIEGGITGVIETSTGPLLISIRPILTSRNEGPPRGSLVLARLLDKRFLADMSATLQAPVQLVDLRDVPASSSLDLQTNEGMPHALSIEENTAEIYLVLRDLELQPISALKVSMSRKMWREGEKAQFWVLAILALVGIARTCFNLAFIQRRVVSRVAKLSELIADVNRTGDLSRRAEHFGSDEIGHLAESMNQMLAQLHVTQETLMGTRERLELEASHDPLTGALNRRAGLEAIERELSRCRRDRRTMALFILDIDNFKSINDTFGHGGGDAVLIGISKSLTSSLRPFDTLIRAGGDEFLIVTPGTGHLDAQHLGDRLITRLRATVTEWQQAHLKVTVSIGCACCSGELSPDELIALADRALYRAKAKGRDCFESEDFNSNMVTGTLNTDLNSASRPI
jgi:diguanylate cyclase (GGDEF)-like protein